MLLIFGVVICISTAIAASINDTNTAYVLAKVLFYKNAKGQIVVANGPIPSIANLAIRDDIISRIEDTSVSRVKIIPIYNDSKGMPKSVNIYQLIKNEHKPVFVTEVKKRLTRNIIKDWWNKLWGHKKNIGRIKKKMTVDFLVTSLPDSNNTSIKKAANGSTGGNSTTQEIAHTTTSTTESKFIKGKQTDATQKERVLEASTTSRIHGKKMQEHNETTVSGKLKENVKVTENPQADSLNSLEAYDDFIPNDIYYSVEKRCVNWSDLCDVQTGGWLNMSSSNFNYFKKPTFTQNGPLME